MHGHSRPLMRPLFFVETTDLGTRYCALAARSLGYEPIFLCDPGAYSGDVRAQLLEQVVRVVDTSSVDAVVAAVHDEVGAEEATILSFVDSRLIVACRAALALSAPGLHPAVVALKSKAHVASLVSELGPPTIAFRQGAIPRLELRTLLERYGALVVKPDLGAGGVGVLVLRGVRELEGLDARLANLELPVTMRSGQFVAQPQVAGPVLSLEGYVVGARLHALGYTDRLEFGLTESGSEHPVDDRLAADHAEAMRAATQTLVERAGLERGYLHVEFVLSERGPVLIDANVGRLGGGPIGELLALAHQVDPALVYRHAIEVGVFGSDASGPYRAPAERRRARAVLYGLARGGRILGIDAPARPGVRHTAVLGPGDRVAPMGSDDWSWVGILTGYEPAVSDALHELRIHTTSGTEHPCC